MPTQVPLNPLVLVKLILWILAIVGATVLLRRRRVTSGVRLAFLIAGTLLFGFVLGIVIPGGMNPNPVASLRTLFSAAVVRRQFAAPVAVMLLILLAAVFVSNKSICGWGCQLGLLQDALHRVGLPKWRPPFWLSNTIRVGAFVALIAGLVVGGLDWISVIDPFKLFSLDFTWAIGWFSLAVLGASLFVYRPWCHFLCPFGLLSWGVEQGSLFRPRVNREACKACERCVRACPGQAMADFYAGNKVHADCFACGACIEACPQDEALGWWRKGESERTGDW